MKLVLLLFAFMACYFIVDAENIPILTNIRKVVGEEKDKNYKYIYHTGNGIYQEEQGVIKNADDPGYETQVQQGQYQYVSPEGKVIVVKYTADENGFQPVGDHIPTPPPIPKEIQKLLDLLATKKPDPADNYDYDNQDYDSAPITTPKPKPRGSSNRNKAKFDTLELDLPK